MSDKEETKKTLIDQYIDDFGITKNFIILFAFVNIVYMMYTSYIKKQILTMQRINFSDQRVVKIKLLEQD